VLSGASDPRVRAHVAAAWKPLCVPIAHEMLRCIARRACGPHWRPQLHCPRVSPATAAAAAAATVACAAAITTTPARATAMTENRVLGPGHHRVAVTQFTVLTQNGRPSGESSFSSFGELCAWVKRSGYDGLELGVDDIRRSFMPRASYAEIASHMRQVMAEHQTPCFGVLYHITDFPGGFASTVKGGGTQTGNIGPQDMDLNDPDFFSALRERLILDRSVGAEYVTFQINLPPQYLNTGGMYRDGKRDHSARFDLSARFAHVCIVSVILWAVADHAYLRRIANDIALLQGVCFDLGLNFYVETHMDRVSEDLVSSSTVISLHHWMGS
jgi:hypothetical protein